MDELGIIIYSSIIWFLASIVFWFAIWKQSSGKMKIAALFMIAYLVPSGIIFMFSILGINSESFGVDFFNQFRIYIEVFKQIMFVGAAYYIYLAVRGLNISSK